MHEPTFQSFRYKDKIQKLAKTQKQTLKKDNL